MVLPNETTAFQTYRLLQYHGISPEHLAIVGEGYSSPKRVGLLEPMQIALRKAFRMAVLAGSLGTIGELGLLLVLSGRGDVPFTLYSMLFALSIGVVGGFLGAVVGALTGFLGEGSTSGIYHHHLHRGHYLLLMEGPETLVRWAQEVLSYYSTSRTY